MTRLLKAGQAARDVTAFVGARAALPTVPIRSTVQQALAEAHAEIARLHAERIETKTATERDASDAYSAGVADGKQSADDATAQRLEKLDATLCNALEDWDARLTAAQTLAIELARTALRQLFSESTDLGDLVTRAITTKFATLRSECVVAIVVSPIDFPDEPSVEALRRRIPDARTAVVQDATLAAGACRLDLKLGHVDLSIGALAEEIDAAFSGLLRTVARA